MNKQMTERPTQPPEEALKETPRIGSVDVEVFSRNVARLVEEGGKALAAYLKPRESGEIKDNTAEGIAEVVKTLAKVLEYWLADPERASELQSSLGKYRPDETIVKLVQRALRQSD